MLFRIYDDVLESERFLSIARIAEAAVAAVAVSTNKTPAVWKSSSSSSSASHHLHHHRLLLIKWKQFNNGYYISFCTHSFNLLRRGEKGWSYTRVQSCYEQDQQQQQQQQPTQPLLSHRFKSLNFIHSRAYFSPL